MEVGNRLATGPPVKTKIGVQNMSLGNWVIGLLIGLLIASVILPVAFANVFGADQSGWDASTIALWALIPIAVVIGLVVKVFKSSGLGSDG